MSSEGKQDRPFDEVTEAGMESFPASDPPAFNARDGESRGSEQLEEPTTAQLREGMRSRRTMGVSSAREPSAAPFDTDDEAAGRPAQASAIRQAMAQENVRLPHDQRHGGRPEASPPAWNRTAPRGGDPPCV